MCVYIYFMARKLTEDQEKFAHYAWMLSRHRTALAQQLADVDGYAREAIRTAAQYGVRQNILAELTGFTPGRISQIVNEDTSDAGKALRETIQAWQASIENPQEHLARLSKKNTPEDLEDWEEKYRLIYNKNSDTH